MTRRIALMQSNYLPWRGYFDLMARCDEFVVYDSRQYTVNDWRNRNRIKASNGVAWLTVPVLTKGRTGQLIREAEVVDHGWIRKHRGAVAAALGRAPHGPWLMGTLDEAFERAAATRLLHEINVDLLQTVHEALGLSCVITDDADHLDPAMEALTNSERVAELVHRAGGSHYLTGPSGLDYLDLADFDRRSIDVEVLDYSTLGPYPQMFGDFEANLSIIDLLANTGPDAAGFLTSTGRSISRPAI